MENPTLGRIEAEYLNGVRSGNVRKKGLRNRNRRIRRDRASGMSYIDLGAKYELSRAILHQIINRRWRRPPVQLALDGALARRSLCSDVLRESVRFDRDFYRQNLVVHLGLGRASWHGTQGHYPHHFDGLSARPGASVSRRSARARASVRRWPWSSRQGRSVQVKLIKMGGRLVRHARRLIFQLSEVSVPRRLFEGVLDHIGRLSPAPS